jgi:hypothetical protein
MRGIATRRHVLIGIEIAFNFVLPFVAYELAKPHLGEIRAIMAAAVPPILWILAEFARSRRVDALSILVLGGIALSLAGFALGGSAKLLLLRESLVTGLIGVIFLGSVLIRRPLVYVLARASAARRSAEEHIELETAKDDPVFRRTMAVMTFVWGSGLVAETGLRGTLVFTLPTGQFLIVSPIIGYGTYGLLILWTFLYVRWAARHQPQEESAIAELP